MAVAVTSSDEEGSEQSNEDRLVKSQSLPAVPRRKVKVVQAKFNRSIWVCSECREVTDRLPQHRQYKHKTADMAKLKADSRALTERVLRNSTFKRSDIEKELRDPIAVDNVVKFLRRKSFAVTDTFSRASRKQGSKYKRVYPV